MDEREWLACTDPRLMVKHLRGRASDRRMRLFACACVRAIWHLLRHPRSLQAVSVAERLADGLAGAEEARSVEAAARAVTQNASERRGPGWGSTWAAAAAARHTLQAREAGWETSCKAAEAAMDEAAEGRDPNWTTQGTLPTQRAAIVADAAREAARRVQCSLLRDICGPPPFRPVVLSPAWRSPTVLSLAEAVYEHRQLPSGHLEVERLAILADALEEVGCDNALLLEHLRGPGPHVRGCVALDAVLGLT